MPGAAKAILPKSKPQRARSPLVIAVAIAGCLLMCWLGIVTRRPYIIAAHMWADNNTVQERILAVKLENQRLRALVAALSTDAGKERAARRTGYLKPNEVRLMFADR